MLRNRLLWIAEAGANPDSVFEPFFPPPAGTRFMVVHYPPDSTGGSEMDPDSYNAEIRMRTADGDEVLVTPGTAIIQRGTRHSWHNRSGRNVTIVWTVVGAEWR